MPKRILAYAFAAAALTLAACGYNGNINNLYGVATPTPVPTSTASPSPDPKASTAAVSVFYQASPLPNQPVMLSTSVNGSIGPVIRTQNTDSTGKTTFSNLTPTVTYCFWTNYTPPGALMAKASSCTPYWGTTGVTLAF